MPYAQQPGQYGQAYPPPPPPRDTNGFAIASLIFGIIGGVLLSVIFGIIALVQTKSQSALQRGYREKCASAFAGYSPTAANDPDFATYALYPSQETWDQGDRGVVCIAMTKDKRTGSIKA